MTPGQPNTGLPRVAFYVGGFEAIGGIEACFQDLCVALAAHPLDRSLFVWADPLPQLEAIAASGTAVHRVGLRSGCRWALPDWALFLRHGAKLNSVDRVVFGKIPPLAVLKRMLAMLEHRHGGRPELQYITAYRPAELWPDGLPPHIAEAIDTMIVQSPDFTTDLRAMGFTGRIVEVPYLPPLTAIPALTPPPGERVCRLGFLGRFVVQKNLFYLLDMLAEMEGDAVELHLFGEGEHDARLRAEVARRALPVIFHGAVPRAAVPAAIDSCDIFLNPSISEGQCLVALEVLSRGRPFLASAVGAIPQILARGKLGAVVPLDDAAAAAAIVRSVVAEWRTGGWAPADIAAAYAAAYQPDDILARYVALFGGATTETSA